MGELSEKVVVVTGAARGIGRCIAETLAKDGARVVLGDMRGAEAEAVAAVLAAQGFAAQAITLDIADPAGVQAMADAVLAQYGRVDALVNNAGLDAPPGVPWEIDEAAWRRVIDVDLNGAWWCTRAFLPAFMAQRAGRVVFISSVAARVPGDGDTSPAYAAAKAGLIGLTVALSAQLEPYGILVNAIAPGPTGSTGQPYSEAACRAYEERHPLGFGGPQPIADGVKYLLASSGDWLSGAVLNISGGEVRGV
jgi:3-oxoacyl-[acyl-carrier protein] reductase